MPDALTCTICGARIDRRITVLDTPDEPTWPSHALCRRTLLERRGMTTTLRAATITLPLPPAGLSPNNSRGGFVQLPNGRRLYPKATAAREYRLGCVLLLRALGPGPLGYGFARLSFTFRWCTSRRAWDADNALSASKPLVDALRDAGILRDDSARRVAYGAVESVKCPRGCRCGGGVDVTIVEVRP